MLNERYHLERNGAQLNLNAKFFKWFQLHGAHADVLSVLATMLVLSLLHSTNNNELIAINQATISRPLLTHIV